MSEGKGEVGIVPIGQPPENRRAAQVKSLWILVWLAFLGGPIGELAGGELTTTARVLGSLGLTLFVVAYCLLLYRKLAHRELAERVQYALLSLLASLALVLSLTLGPNWLALFTFTSTSVAAVLPVRRSRWIIPMIFLVIILIGLRDHEIRIYLVAFALPSLLGGFAMIGVQQLITTTHELRQAREEVARLAANEERLRLARDLHDLLGHSLSLITLKSELAGRMLPGKPDDAARQVADIEKVSRQALVDVREAVTGYRRPRLAVELAGARAALHAAGIEAVIDPALERPQEGLAAEAEGALAWALREAVTNVVRHSGADRCELLLSQEWEADERRCLCLAVTDNGGGPPRAPRDGNGLGGLRERLALADGHLETGPAPTGGFTLRAHVPLTAPPQTCPDTAAPTPASQPAPDAL